MSDMLIIRPKRLATVLIGLAVSTLVIFVPVTPQIIPVLLIYSAVMAHILFTTYQFDSERLRITGLFSSSVNWRDVAMITFETWYRRTKYGRVAYEALVFIDHEGRACRHIRISHLGERIYEVLRFVGTYAPHIGLGDTARDYYQDPSGKPQMSNRCEKKRISMNVVLCRGGHLGQLE